MTKQFEKEEITKKLDLKKDIKDNNGAMNSRLVSKILLVQNNDGLSQDYWIREILLLCFYQQNKFQKGRNKLHLRILLKKIRRIKTN